MLCLQKEGGGHAVKICPAASLGHILASNPYLGSLCASVCAGAGAKYERPELQYTHFNAVCLQNQAGYVGQDQDNSGVLVCLKFHPICDSLTPF
jgi:hypothetical protein